MTQHYLLLLLLLLAACEKETKWPLQEKKTPVVVVDGMITDETKKQSIHLTESFDTLNQVPLPLSGADVIISSDGNVYHLREKVLDPGTYVSETAFAGQVNSEYSLLVNSSNKVYTAKAKIASGVVSFTPAKFVWNSSNGLYSVESVADVYTPDPPAMYELILDWSHLPGYASSDSVSTHARLIYYSLPTLDVSEIFAPATEKVYFPAGTILVERRYSLTTEYAAFLRALLLETTWHGGYFTTASANVPTNLSNGAVGYFSACSVNSMILTVGGK
ncbi:MAG: DUF4249 family protein [Bacteroidetes bacterium]|nr:DUF4249 family protein [Bacteroidota bacterium]